MSTNVDCGDCDDCSGPKYTDSVSGLLLRARHLFSQRPLPPQDVVVVLGEAVRFVAHVLQQPQRVRAAAQPQRFVAAIDVDQLFLLGEREHERRL